MSHSPKPDRKPKEGSSAALGTAARIGQLLKQMSFRHSLALTAVVSFTCALLAVASSGGGAETIATMHRSAGRVHAMSAGAPAAAPMPMSMPAMDADAGGMAPASFTRHKMAAPEVAMMHGAGSNAMGDGGSGGFQGVVAQMQGVRTEGSTQGELQGAVLLKEGYVSVETEAVAAAMEAVRTAILALGGDVQSSSTSTDQWLQGSWQRAGKPITGPTHGNMHVRIPSAKFDEGRTAVSSAVSSAGAGKVVSTSESVQDATAQYVDTVSRQKTAQAALKRMEVLLGAANSVQDVMMVQREMDAITDRIESAAAVRKSLESRATMSNLHVSFSIPQPPQPTPAPPPVWSAGDALSRALSSLGTAAQKGVEVLIYTAVFAVPVALLLTLAVLVGRKVVARFDGHSGSGAAAPSGYAAMRG